VEKYLKAFLVRHQIDFPKTHDIGKLLAGVAAIDLPQVLSSLATALREADTLTPFGVEVRYPSDAPELLPGEEADALAIARQTRDAVMAVLAPYLSGPRDPRRSAV
jgi:HEPN domain-containing protein